MSGSGSSSLQARALQSGGQSGAAIYEAVAAALRSRTPGGLLVDVGCGTGRVWDYVSHQFDRYVGVDGYRHEAFPDHLEFLRADLDVDPIPLPGGTADAVIAVETIEHLENPRAFVRELVRVVAPGGSVVITTPNQLSLRSLLTLATRSRFAAFQDCDYPAHRTALLEVDLQRIASECGLGDVRISYTLSGRIPLTRRHYSAWLASSSPRWLSDNILLTGSRQ